MWNGNSYPLIAAIVGLRPIGEHFDPKYMDEDTIKFGKGKAIYTTL